MRAGLWVSPCCEEDLEQITADNIEEYLDMAERGFPFVGVWSSEREALQALRGQAIHGS